MRVAKDGPRVQMILRDAANGPLLRMRRNRDALHQKTRRRETRRFPRQALKSGKLLQFPGAFNPLCAQMIERKGFDGVYISGAVMSADLCLPDIGISTLTEFAERGHQIARVTDLPTIIDIDTGFGEPMSAARSVRTMEEMGISACHIEDQVMPKRCGHLDGKEVVDVATMVQRVQGRRRRQARSELHPDCALGRQRRRGPRQGDRSDEGLCRCRRRHDFSGSDGEREGIRSGQEGDQGPDARQHDRVRKIAAPEQEGT